MHAAANVFACQRGTERPLERGMRPPLGPTPSGVGVAARPGEGVIDVAGSWLLLALIALGGELLTMSFYLVYEALAAVLTAVLSLVLPQVGAQIFAFVVFSLLGLTVLRPRTVQYLVRATRSPTQFYPDMVGRVVTVRERVTDHSGLVDAGGGEYFRARSWNRAAGLRSCTGRASA